MMSVRACSFDALSSVLDQFAARGMPDISPSEIQVDTPRWVRYGPKKKAYYRIERRISRAGNEYFVGAFGFKGDGPHQIEFDGRRLTPAEAEELRARQASIAEMEQLRRKRDVRIAADRALDTWRGATLEGKTPYTRRKRIEVSTWVRYWRDCVVVPMCRYDSTHDEMLRGVQIIRPNGDKRFTTGMDKAGCACVLGLHELGAPVLVCEGFATAASVWMALDRRYRVVVAFDAGNLLPVAEVLHAIYPNSRLLFCADDDYLRDNGNIGRVKANNAAKVFGDAVIYPLFRDRGARKGDHEYKDFNDLHVVEGLDEVRYQVSTALRWLHKV
ncbi:MAG: toprim domain-containing protein [Burkholderiales bacterium]|jgi:putative DNA primase/helicase|nr:toprim domain-containing protein [Burkholderiales bacterium]